MSDTVMLQPYGLARNDAPGLQMWGSVGSCMNNIDPYGRAMRLQNLVILDSDSLGLQNLGVRRYVPSDTDEKKGRGFNNIDPCNIRLRQIPGTINTADDKEAKRVNKVDLQRLSTVYATSSRNYDKHNFRLH